MSSKRPKPIGGGYSRDVEYYIPNKKRPIVSSTKATCDSLKMFIELGYNTPNKILNIKETKEWILGCEEEIVCNAYIKKGYGDLELNFK